MSSIDESVTTDIKFATIPHWLIELDLSDKAFRLYAILSKYADNADGTSYPGRGTLARLMHCHRSSVDRAVEELVEAGCITKQVRVKDGRYTSSLYTVRRIPPSRTHAATPVAPVKPPSSHPCDIELEPENVEPENTLAATPPKSERRVKDDLFETIAEACGISLTGITRTARGQLNKAVKELREVGATSEQVKHKAKAYRAQYPNATLTPTALIKHWSSFAELEKKHARPSVWDTYERPEYY
jgi:DNA-binding transcriptional regulator YhcF (GntR family)